MIHRSLRWLSRKFRDAASWRARRSWNVEYHDVSRAAVDEVQATLERILTRNILAFWYPHTIDEENGGYRITHDPRGGWSGRQGNKQLVSQSRVLWFFSRLMTSPYRAERYGAAARHGFAFLRDRLWDDKCGGFFWEVDSTGRTPTEVDKHLYGQAFGLYALAEYAIATGDSQAESMARELYGLLEQHAHDTANGGFREFFRRDWHAAEPSFVTYMENRADTKQLNTHIHLLEAFTRYHVLVREPAVRDRLIELILIMSNTVVRKRVTACTDVHDVDWTPAAGPAHSRVSYGHDLQNISLLIEACETATLSNALLRDFYESLFYNAWRFGLDHRHGGFYYQGPLGKFATARHKTWWVQAEALLGAMHMYRLTRGEVYFRCFRETLQWITRHQIDWDLGEWHRRIGTDWRPSGAKTGDQVGSWKTPYHNGRAIIRCLELVGDEQRRLAGRDNVRSGTV